MEITNYKIDSFCEALQLLEDPVGAFTTLESLVDHTKVPKLEDLCYVHACVLPNIDFTKSAVLIAQYSESMTMSNKEVIQAFMLYHEADRLYYSKDKKDPVKTASKLLLAYKLSRPKSKLQSFARDRLCVIIKDADTARAYPVFRTFRKTKNMIDQRLERGDYKFVLNCVCKRVIRSIDLNREPLGEPFQSPCSGCRESGTNIYMQKVLASHAEQSHTAGDPSL